MRNFVFAVCFALALLPPARAAETPLTLSINLDWTGFARQRKLAAFLQNEGHLPLPMIYVGGKLRALLPSEFVIRRNTKALHIDIGIPQLVERPIYKIDITPGRSEKLVIQTESLDLTMFPYDPKLDLHLRGHAVLLKKLIHAKTTISPREGVYHLSLPAAPFAALTDFTMATEKGMTRNRVIPLVLERNGRFYRPFTSLAHQHSTKTYVEALNAQATPGIYRKTVDRVWFTLRLCIKCSLEPSPPELIRLESIPSGARIYVNGTRQTFSMTDTVMQESRELLADIILRKSGYRDCPVHPQKVRNPAKNGISYDFMCRLQKN